MIGAARLVPAWRRPSRVESDRPARVAAPPGHADDARMSTSLTRLIRSLQQSARRLRQEWRYAAAVIGIFGLGIGPAAAMLSVVDKVLLRPLNYADAERVGLLRISLGQLRLHPGLAMGEAIDIRQANIFESLEIEQRIADASYGPPDRLVPIRRMVVTTGLLPMLGIHPIIGRPFQEEDLPPFVPFVPPPPGTPPPPPPPPPTLPVLLDHGAWQRLFGGDPGVINRAIQVDGAPAVIIGVLPPGVRIVTGRAAPAPVDFYQPMRLLYFRGQWFYPTLVKLKPGDTFAHAQQALDALAAGMAKRYPDQYAAGGLRFTLTPALEDMTRTTRPALRAAAAAVLLLLTIAFANAAALVVARLRTRDHDFAIRSAIGASRGQLVVDALAESLWLGAGGVVAGGLIGIASVAGIRAIIPRSVPRWDEIGVGWDLLLYSAGLALFGFFVAGLFPAWRISRGSVAHVLRAGSVQGGRAEGSRARLVLVGAQIALTVVLAFGCVQLLRSARAIGRVDLGYEPNVLTLSVPYDFRRFRSPGERAQLYQRIRDRVRQVPGVTSVGVSTHVPLSGSTLMDGWEADLTKEPDFDPYANYQGVTPGYFETLKIPFVEGRDFTDQEDGTRQPVAIVDVTLARTAFPDERTFVGKKLRFGSGPDVATIIGVVGHVRSIDVGREVRPQIYHSIGNLFTGYGIVVVRAAGDVRALAGAVTSAINEVGPGRAVSNVTMIADNVESATSTLVAITGLVSFLAISAGLLSAIGLYLVLALVVHHRRRATAIRTALGASRAQVIWQHSKTSGYVMLAALPIGVGLAFAIAPLFADLLYGVAHRDRGSVALAMAVAVVAGALGTALPVLRAANGNIVKTLRDG